MSSHRNDVKRELERAGYILVRSKNHFVYRNATGHTIIVPNHNKMNEFTYRGIMKKIGRLK